MIQKMQAWLAVVLVVLFSVFTIQQANFAISDYEQYAEILYQQNIELRERLDLMKFYNIKPLHFEWLEIYCNKYDLDFDFMVRLLLVESNDNPTAKSPKNAYGLMQVQYPTAKDVDSTLVSYWQLYDPCTNIRIGTAYFRWLLDWYDGDYKLAALAYNQGVARIDRLLAEGIEPYDGYFKKIGATF